MAWVLEAWGSMIGAIEGFMTADHARLELMCLVAMTFLACDPPPKMRVNAASITTGADVVVTFDDRLAGRATNQYWIALQPANEPASSTTGRIVLERTDRLVRLRTTAPGVFEVRLHGSYPKTEHHLLARIPVKVEGWPVKTGIEPKVSADECRDRWLAEQKLDHVEPGHPGLARACDPPSGPAR